MLTFTKLADDQWLLVVVSIHLNTYKYIKKKRRNDCVALFPEIVLYNTVRIIQILINAIKIVCKMFVKNNEIILTEYYIVINLDKEIIFEEHIANYRKQIDQYESKDCS